MSDDSSFDATMGRDELTIAVGVTCSAGSYLHLMLLCIGDNCSGAVHDVLGVEKGNEKGMEESPAFMYLVLSTAHKAWLFEHVAWSPTSLIAGSC